MLHTSLTNHHHSQIHPITIFTTNIFAVLYFTFSKQDNRKLLHKIYHAKINRLMYAIGGNNSYGSKCYRTNLTTIFTHIERTSPTIKYFATEHSSHKCSNFPHFANQPNKTKITIIDEVFTVGPTLPHPIRRCVSEIYRLCHKINTLYQIYFCI